MPKVRHPLLALCLASALVSSGLTSVTRAPLVEAAPAAPWTTPTAPPKCTETQKNLGDVAGCIVHLGPGMPEDRGWPRPPFPEPTPGAVIPWVDLAKGASGAIVEKVQLALNQRGATLVADGQFGSLTEAAVKSFQTANSLPSTGIVNKATADLLGVENRAAGAFPGAGWNWLGWGYNGSTALYQWERLFVRNTQPVGAVRVGGIAAFADALPLFEGFMREVQAAGYVITGGSGGYVFRCTASTRKDCAGLTRSSLSNHAYGLAIDFNTTANPMRTYYGINGATACQTPMQTDMPQWVIQTAEKWGLYWGGYGWSSGCSSPSQVKSSASRDPMHFEFNGTVDQARAILAFNTLGGIGACFDVADANGAIAERCYRRNELPGANTRVVVDTDAPTGATAALVNITTTAANSGAFITAESCGVVPNARGWSNGNTRTGRAVASTAVVALDAQGRFCLYQSSSMHTIVDVQGYFAPSSVSAGNLYTPVTPQRATDTRTLPFCTPAGACVPNGPVIAETEIVIQSSAPVDAVATVANLTVNAPADRGYLTADTCSSLVPGPQSRSNLNFAFGDTVANLGVVPSVSTDQGVQFCTFASTRTQQIVDVQGFFAPAVQGGLGYTALTPNRVVDTRQCWTDPITSEERCQQINQGGSIVRARAPAGASAVVVNLTAINAVSGGYVTAASCDTLVAGPQSQSNLNAVVGAAVANLAIVPVAADGTYCVFVSATMHIAIDIVGTFSNAGTQRYLPITPVRVHDSRPPPLS